MITTAVLMMLLAAGLLWGSLLLAVLGVATQRTEDVIDLAVGLGIFAIVLFLCSLPVLALGVL